jgi:organic hydroperoxide reductase OsmC/OhrA
LLYTTLRAIAGSALFDFTDLQVEASGTVRKADSGYSFAQIVVRPNLKIASAEERDRALELLKRAEKLCLVSYALGTNLKFEPQLEIVKAPLM